MKIRHITEPDIEITDLAVFFPTRGNRLECSVCGRRGFTTPPRPGSWNYGCSLGHHSCAGCGLVLAHTITGKPRRTHQGCHTPKE